MPTDNRTKSSKSHQDAPRCSVLWSFKLFFKVGICRNWVSEIEAIVGTLAIHAFQSRRFDLKMIPTILPSQNCCCILLFPACAQCPVRGKCALFCRDGSVAHGTRHFAKTSEITICDAHWRHNMSQHVTTCHQERRTLHCETENGTVHTSLDGRIVRMRLFSSPYKAIHFISIDLNGLCPVSKRDGCFEEPTGIQQAPRKIDRTCQEPETSIQLSLTHAKQPRKEYISKLDGQELRYLLRQY